MKSNLTPSPAALRYSQPAPFSALPPAKTADVRDINSAAVMAAVSMKGGKV